MLCKLNGIHNNFSSLRTPKQNGIVKRKNKTLHNDKNHALWKLYSKTLMGRGSEYYLICSKHNTYKINVGKRLPMNCGGIENST